MRTPFLLAALTALAACEPLPPPPSPVPPMPAEPCGADGYASLVGAPLAAVTLPAGLNLRVIRPGDIITMDLQPTRLNLELDRNGTIVRVFCG